MQDNVEGHGEGRFADRLRAATRANDSLLCVGLDPDIRRFPPGVQGDDLTQSIVAFNAGVIAATSDLVCAYKPNLGFYVAYGAAGIAALEATRRLIPRHIPALLDAKVGDMANTAAAYATGYFETWGFDAVTVNPYLGEDSLEPFMRHPDKGVFVVCKTSDPGSGDLQDVPTVANGQQRPLYLTVAERASAWGERWPATLGLVVGATYPDELAAVRQRCPDRPILLPGVGAQTGDLSASLRTGLTTARDGLLVSASRSVIYAGGDSEPNWQDAVRTAALELREAINRERSSLIPA